MPLVDRACVGSLLEEGNGKRGKREAQCPDYLIRGAEEQ